MNDSFVSRWGDPELDKGYLTLPGFILRHYMKFKNMDGETVGLTANEFIFFCHVMSFHYDSRDSVAKPSLTTVAQRMGVTKRSVIRFAKSLEEKGAMTIQRRPGETSIYEFGELVRQCKFHNSLEVVTAESPVTPESPPGVTEESPPGVTEESPKEIEYKKENPNKKKDSSPDGESAPAHPQEALDEKEKDFPENDLYYAVLGHVFGIKNKTQLAAAENSKLNARTRAGTIHAWLAGKKDRFRGGKVVGFISAPAKPEHVARFVDDYQHGRIPGTNTKNLSVPRDPEKFVEYWRAWASSLKQQDQPGAAPRQSRISREQFEQFLKNRSTSNGNQQ